MHPYHLNMLGLVFDILGAFLVSVEAIKLENFRALRQKIDVLHRYTLSPKIIFVDERMITNASRRYVFWFTAAHHIAGIAVLVVANAVLDNLLLLFFLGGK